jgi:hypothetical protein
MKKTYRVYFYFYASKKKYTTEAESEADAIAQLRNDERFKAGVTIVHTKLMTEGELLREKLAKKLDAGANVIFKSFIEFFDMLFKGKKMESEKYDPSEYYRPFNKKKKNNWDL